MFKFITHRPLWVNIIAGLVLALAFFFFFLLSLDWITGHGKSASVPSVNGKSYEEANKILRKAGFDVEIQDSIYADTLKPMMVMKQIPEADEVVKTNRTVYLIVSRAVPPFVEMPNLKGYSLRNATMILKNLDLKLGDTTFRPDFAKNAVLEQLYNGAEIKPGTQIRKGSLISFVLGDGVGNREFAVPVIVGMKFGNAKAMLEEAGLGIGAVVTDENVSDTINAYIYWQNPPRFDDEKRLLRIRSGQLMDVKLQADKPAKDSVGSSESKDANLFQLP
ncbi:MAG TPA: PASTA domain-containing protein [Chitinophagaceae bacterium]|jgi:beta-lactam-binding protein with PASTA domain|nr:PASTA domain-containing protein [Chitinophagaceae bacterium]